MRNLPPAKVLLWDIESGPSLNADFGVILCIGYMWLGEKRPKVVTMQDFAQKTPIDDKPLVKWFLENVWNEADIAVGWYSSGHDEPFLRTRAIKHGLPAPKDVTTLDLWAKFRKRFKLRSNRLATVAEFLGLEEKTPVKEDAWLAVLYGSKKAMRYIVDHCRRDVEVLREAYERIKSYVKVHPRVTHDYMKCRVCGSSRLQRRGYSYSAAKGKSCKVQCQECWSWDTKLPKEMPHTIWKELA